ncbi:MAG: 30S ribosomal protein S14 [Gemmataceae bacterium]|nr:30S ribosomal protein S14 [Gemmataceae bacterium]
MSTTAKAAQFRKQLKQIDAHKAELRKPEASRDKSKVMEPRALIHIRTRCRICGRSRAVYRKFGICRICFRNKASAGLIPGVRKASW